MTRTQHLVRVGIIFCATLIAVSIFLGNQRPAHASLATDILCLVYSELNIFGDPIPHLTADECDAPPPAGSGTLKVVKIVAGGGSASPSDFSLHVKSGGTDVGGSPQPGSVAGTSYVGLAPGEYTVSETGPDDYTASFIGACNSSGVVTVPDSLIPVVCTITNTFSGPPPTFDDEDTLARCSDTTDNDDDDLIDLADPDCAEFIPTLTIVKNTSGGNATFNFTVSGATSDTESVLTAGGTGSSDPIALGVGVSTVLEDAAVDWTLSGVACTDGEGSVGTPVLRGMEITAAIGDEITCTFSNTFTEGGGGGGQGVLVVTKIVSGGSAAPGDFSLHVKSGDPEVAGSPQAGTSAGTSYTLSAGSYTVSETGTPSGYTGAFSGDCNASGVVSVSSGATSTCTITNTFSDSGSDDPNPTDDNDTSSRRGGGGGRVQRTLATTTPQGQVLGAATSAPSCGPTVLTYMRRGMKNNPTQVRLLQQFLNRSPDTQVAQVGPGSPGQETGFFGPLTDAAVKKFQQKYAKEVLDPWIPYGYTGKPTGYVYKTTSYKINQLHCPTFFMLKPKLP